jgi:hypothetical protein
LHRVQDASVRGEASWYDSTDRAHRSTQALGNPAAHGHVYDWLQALHAHPVIFAETDVTNARLSAHPDDRRDGHG